MSASNPLLQFARWYRDAQRHRDIKLPDAMCLSTVSANGYPSARMVLLKGLDPRGFIFYTNGRSPKGRDLTSVRRAALTFYWQPLHRQVRVEGAVSRVPKKEADAYFATRPRLSQIGSWASRQSEVLSSRAELLRRFKAYTVGFKGKPVPAPPYWQGFCVIPRRIEFWEEGANRLHERWVYERGGKGLWERKQLFP